MPCIGAVGVQTKALRAVHLSASVGKERQTGVSERHPDPAG